MITTATRSPRLQALGPSITEIMRVSGAAGASIGVLDGTTGEVHLAGFGQRDVDAQLFPDEHTVYHLASLSKSFTAVAIGILVADGKLKFNDRMCDILPSFRHDDENVATQSTVLDFLSHRTGLATKNAIWQQNGHELLLEKKDTVPIVSYLEVVEPLGEKWIYNNWGYDILSHVVEAVSGQHFADFLSDRILKPLGLNETTMALHPPAKSWAHGYMPGPSGELTDVGRPVIASGTVQQGANGVKSTVRDLLTYYKAVLEAWKEEDGASNTDTPAKLSDSSLKNVKELLTPHIPLDPAAEPHVGGQWYGAGWAIADLPAPLGSIGTNGMFLSSMPLVGRGAHREKTVAEDKKTRVWYHNGSLVGFFSSVHILPEGGTIIIVLVNSIPKNDAADWIGQLLVEEFLQCTERNDFVSLARETAATFDGMWKQLPIDMDRARSPGISTRPPSQYEGRYYNKVRNFFIDITRNADQLAFSFQGRTTQYHQLEVFGEDAFCWPLSEAESRNLGRWPDLDVSTYVFYFEEDDEGQVAKLRWEHDPDVLGGETFKKIRTPEPQQHIHAEL